MGKAIEYLRDQSGLAIVLLEQYLDFCRELAGEVYIMERGELVHHGPPEELDRPDERQYLSV